MADVCVCEILKHIYHLYYIFVLRKEIVIILDNWVMDKVGTCKLYPGINTYCRVRVICMYVCIKEFVLEV